MASKRSRLARSSSSGDTSILLTLPSPSPSPSLDTRNPPTIFFIGSPVRDPVHSTSEGGCHLGFILDMCYRCRKRIAGDKEVFMYSMRAFCTPECRAEQINIDNPRKLPIKPKFNMMGKLLGR